MKTIILSKLQLISFKKKRARKIEFDSKRTILIGDNKTGKSSIIKSIYSTFGAIPNKIDSLWLTLNVVSHIEFYVDSERYSIVKNGSRFGVFNANDELIISTNKVTELSQMYSQLFDFRIFGTLKDGKSTLLPIQFLLCPYYVDQDSSWSDNWNSFSSLNYIKKGKELLINYFTGLRPNSYYDTLSEINILKVEIEELTQQRKITKTILAEIQGQISKADFNIDIELFKEEIKELLVECEVLKHKQDELKTKLISYQEIKLNKEVQFKLAERGLKESLNDYRYATEIQTEEEIECPSCGAHYNNSILERFELAKDSGTFEDLLGVIAEETQQIKSNIAKTSTELSSTTAEVLKIEELLSIKKGAIEFRDVIEIQGRNEVKRIFDINIKNISQDFNTKAGTLVEKQKILRSFDNREKRKEIKEYYFRTMSKNLKALGSYVTDDKINDIFFKPKQTGSELPRTLLAYYFAIFELIRKQKEISFFPIIIDAPYQQEPDQDHIEKTVKFLDQAQPDNTQMIIGVRDLAGIEIPGRKIFLDEPLNMLKEDQFDEISINISPLLEKMRSGLGLF